MNLEATHIELQAGDFFYVRNPDTRAVVGMILPCPCGCGRIEGLSFSDKPPKRKGDSTWQWDGNIDEPTLTPSLGLGVRHQWEGGKRVRKFHWHGYLNRGRFIDHLHNGAGNFLVTDDGQRISGG